MSKVAITGNASGTGVFTVASPNSNVDRVLTLPDETGTVDTLQRSGNVVQVVNFQTGALATGTTLVPNDDSIPQITEGDQYMSLAITPTSAANILVIEVVFQYGTNTSTVWMATSLFQDATAGALASVVTYDNSVNINQNTFSHTMISGTTSATTFRVRSGSNTAATTTFNGYGGLRVHGGSSASSITITEYTA